MTLLDAALDYAARGWPVFPLHSIRGGYCTCRANAACSRPGKHPRTPHGRSDATADPERVRRFWTCWPDANIGIATGIESGILVVDLDDPHAVDEIRLPDSPCSVTGRGGRHVLYRRPEGGRYITATRVLGPELAVDSRADGGYIVAPPSVHASGRHYAWDLDPDDTPLADAPAWWLELIRREEITATPLPARDDDDELPPDIEALLSAIPADDYTVWRNVGLALAHADPAGGLAWWDWWSSRSPKYDPAAVRSQWRQMVRRGPVANPITLHSIRSLACDLGYEDPLLRAGAEIAAGLLESEQARIAAALVSAPTSTTVERPPDLIPQTGLLGELILWILETSIRPQPELAVAAAAAFLGAVYGRRYRTTTNLRTNRYFVGVAPSGAGKEWARSCVKRLAVDAGATQFLGGEKIASGPGLISALVRSPAQVFRIDEFGIYLQALTGAGAAAHHRDLMATMMALYSSAGSTYLGTEYADSE
ncbi:MAG: bifunctional DNA primase/polymerase, partial [Acidobacteria bacterium]|nr:bifunctional DNA primase/polymerase [Acidobacteriota bacterium]